MPLWASWLRDFDILNLFYDELKSEKMAKFETLIVPRGLILILLLILNKCLSLVTLVENCKVYWFCVYLHSKLAMCLQKFILCTPVQFTYLTSSQLQKEVFLSVCPCLHTVCTHITQSLLTDYTKIAYNLHFINSLSASKSNSI